MRRFFLLLSSVFFLAPSALFAANVDLGFTGGSQDIFFSKQPLVAGETVRVYARVHNFSNVDTTGSVAFYQGNILIGEPQVVSVRANGLSDEVFVDWVVPNAPFNLLSEVKNQSPRDENPSNDVALTALITPEKPAPPPSSGTGALATSVASSGGGSASTGTTSVETVPKKETKAVATKKDAVPSSSVSTPPASPSVKKVVAVPEKGSAEKTTPEAVTIVNDLLKVYVDFKQEDWNTFRFTADANRADPIAYEWSFGDGKTARGKEVVHSYMFAGRYVVSVIAIQSTGERAQTKITLDISFWNLDNWQLWVLLVLLLGMSVLLLNATRKEKGNVQHGDRSAVEEGETPPVLLAREEEIVDAAPKKPRKRPTPRRKPKPTPPVEEVPPEPPKPETPEDEFSE